MRLRFQTMPRVLRALFLRHRRLLEDATVMVKTEHEIKIRNDEVEWKPRPTLSSADYSSAEVWEQER